MKTAILILAAGTSSRMKSPKQLLPYKKTTLLGWVINQALNSNANRVFCVLGAHKHLVEKEIANYNIDCIYNPEYKNGLSTSIKSGVNHLEKLQFDAMLVLLADQPYVNSSNLNQILELSKKNENTIIASKYKTKIGVPALFPKQYFRQLKLLQGDKGAGKLLNASKNILTITSVNINDIDTIEEYNSLLSNS